MFFLVIITSSFPQIQERCGWKRKLMSSVLSLICINSIIIFIYGYGMFCWLAFMPISSWQTVTNRNLIVLIISDNHPWFFCRFFFFQLWILPSISVLWSLSKNNSKYWNITYQNWLSIVYPKVCLQKNSLEPQILLFSSHLAEMKKGTQTGKGCWLSSVYI